MGSTRKPHDELTTLDTITNHLNRWYYSEVRETIPLEGNILVSGDAEADLLAAKIARESLAGGNVWAWGVAIVTASYDGDSGSDVLGSCSYSSEAAFRADAYFTDMVNAALVELAGKLLRRGVTAESIGSSSV